MFDLSSTQLGDTIRIGDSALPKGVTPAIADRDFVLATLKVSSAGMSEAAASEAETEA